MSVDLEVLDAFLDGEPIDVRDVRSALATSDGRDYLVDAWLLRQAVRADAPTAASIQVPVRMAGSRWLVAAGIAASLAGGFYAGRSGGAALPIVMQAPASSITPAVASGAYPVPAATRVIQLEFHSLTSTTGGD